MRAVFSGSTKAWWSNHSPLPNAKQGWQILEEKLSRLDAAPSHILIGMEATSRYGENLYQELEQWGYVLRLLYPGPTHHFHLQRGYGPRPIGSTP
jgi:transposase